MQCSGPDRVLRSKRQSNQAQWLQDRTGRNRTLSGPASERSASPCRRSRRRHSPISEGADRWGRHRHRAFGTFDLQTFAALYASVRVQGCPGVTPETKRESRPEKSASQV